MTAPPSLPPPLPPSIRDQILKYLLPPKPLPPALLSQALIARHTFLPPDDSDIDSFLSPTSARVSAPLLALALGPTPKISDTQYAHDGEMAIARFTIGDEEEGVGVNTYLEHEHEERGWVYRGSEVVGKSDPFSWKNEVHEVESYGGDYWEGFSPVSSEGEGEVEHEHDEDDYWAQYGAGVEHGHEHDHEHGHGQGYREEVMTPQGEPLSLLLQAQGLNSGEKEGEVEREEKVETDGILEQKVRGKVKAQLSKAWSAFSAGQDAEASGFEWLRIGREIAERRWGSVGGEGDDVRVAVVKARIEAVKDVHEALGEEEGSFWRLVEEAIRSYTNAEEEEVPLF